MSTAVQYMSEHVLSHLAKHRSHFSKAASIPPLFVGVQGPQGSGKTFLTSQLKDTLTSETHSLSVAVLSIDDLYLPHDGLVALARSHPHNALLRGRGQPGTHDITTGTDVLTALRRINEHAANEVIVPVFEKSLHGGEGDRLPQGTVVRGPVDVVVMEGWCVGFHPTTLDVIEQRLEETVKGLEGEFDMQEYKKEDIIDVNERLKDYIEWWSFFDLFIQLKPIESSPYAVIYKWRLDQENHMKSRNGGKGMTDDQVKRFVDRYIPGYVFFGDGVTEGSVGSDGQQRLPSWIGSGLKITIDENREVVEVTPF